MYRLLYGIYPTREIGLNSFLPPIVFGACRIDNAGCVCSEYRLLSVVWGCRHAGEGFPSEKSGNCWPGADRSHRTVSSIALLGISAPLHLMCATVALPRPFYTLFPH